MITSKTPGRWTGAGTLAVALAVVLVPMLGASLTTPAASAASGTVTVPTSGPARARFTLPPGWSRESAAATPDEPTVFRHGASTLLVTAPGEVADPVLFGQRQARRGAVRDGITATPAGPRYRLTAPDGRTGELAVVTRGRDAVAVRLLGPDDVAPIVGSLEVLG